MQPLELSPLLRSPVGFSPFAGNSPMPMLDAGLLGSRREICEERIASGAEEREIPVVNLVTTKGPNVPTAEKRSGIHSGEVGSKNVQQLRPGKEGGRVSHLFLPEANAPFSTHDFPGFFQDLGYGTMQMNGIEVGEKRIEEEDVSVLREFSDCTVSDENARSLAQKELQPVFWAFEDTMPIEQNGMQNLGKLGNDHLWEFSTNGPYSINPCLPADDYNFSDLLKGSGKEIKPEDTPQSGGPFLTLNSEPHKVFPAQSGQSDVPNANEKSPNANEKSDVRNANPERGDVSNANPGIQLLEENILVASTKLPIPKDKNLTKPCGSKSYGRSKKACGPCHQRKLKCLRDLGDKKACQRCRLCETECVAYEKKPRDPKLPRKPALLKDSENKHRGIACQGRMQGCKRPFRHPGHCRTNPPRKRGRGSSENSPVVTVTKT